jgi:hypothetical protein
MPDFDKAAFTGLACAAIVNAVRILELQIADRRLSFELIFRVSSWRPVSRRIDSTLFSEQSYGHIPGHHLV